MGKVEDFNIYMFYIFIFYFIFPTGNNILITENMLPDTLGKEQKSSVK